jgi:hypothetical protein
MVIVSSTAGMLLFAAAIQGYWFARNRWPETLILLVLTLLLFRPEVIWDRIQPPYHYLPGKEIFKVADDMKAGDRLQFVVSGETLEGKERTFTFELPLAEGKNGMERVNNTGLKLDDIFGPMEVSMVLPGHNKQVAAIKRAGVDSGWIIETVKVKTDRMSKKVVLIPVFMAAFFLAWFQIRRRKREEGAR